MAVAGEIFELDNSRTVRKENHMRSLLLLFLGVPIPIIILVALFMH
jgi:hypothetical protein